MSDKKKITVLKNFRPLRDEELAAELTPTFNQNVVPMVRRNEKNRSEIHVTHEQQGTRSGMALIGVILSVLSLFILPYVLAPIGIVLGYIGYRNGATTLGMWAMGLGAVGLIGTLIMTSIVY